MNKQTSQQGSAHAVVVICLVLALVTALGWIFYQNFIAKEPSKKDTELLVVKKDSDTKPQATSDPSEGGKYFVVKEWGVRMPGIEGDTLSYKLQDGSNADSGGIEIFSKKLSDGDSKCASYGLVMGRGTENVRLFDSTYGKQGTKAGSYYYMAPAANQYCSEKPDLASYEKKLIEQLEESAKKVELIP